MLHRFNGNPPAVREKLNQIVDALNSLMSLRGDENFIGVEHGPTGVALRLNIDQVLLRVPKTMGGAVRYGKATATWTTGNTVVVTPCVSMTNNAATGEANVTCYIVSPTGTSAAPAITSGDILAYLPITTAGYGVLLPVKQGGLAVKNNGTVVVAAPMFINIPANMANLLEFVANGTGADLRIKASTSNYQAITTEGGVVGWNFVKAH